MPDDSGLSPAQLGTLVVAGYTAPRASIAQVLRMRPDEQARVLMVAIGIAVSAMGVAIFGNPDPEAGSRNILLGYLVTILAGFLQYIALAWLVGFVCSLMGGKGEREDNRTLVAWWALVTSPLSLLIMMILTNGQSAMSGLVLIASGILSFVLLAAYIAETHQFKSTARVCWVMLALLLVFSFVLTSFIPLQAPA